MIHEALAIKKKPYPVGAKRYGINSSHFNRINKISKGKSAACQGNDRRRVVGMARSHGQNSH
jgi:hypothetical protein